MEIKNNSELQEEFNFKPLLEFLIRNKNYLLKFIAFTLLIGSFIFIFQRRTWIGQIQIVLKSDNNVDSLQSKISDLVDDKSSFLMNNFTGLNEKMDLKTEVEILKSPSLIMPIFENYKEYKKSQGKKVRRLDYYEWVEDHLKIDLKTGTSVLNLSFLEKDKDLILTVLSNIKNSYQVYSRKDKDQSLEKGIKYLQEQINIFRKKTLDSNKIIQEFANREDLPEQNPFIFLLNESKEDRKLGNRFDLSLESVRIEAANEIRLINHQLKQLEKEIDKESLRYVLKTIPQLSQIRNDLDVIDKELVFKRTLLKESDKEIKDLKKQKNLQIALLKEQTIGYLYARKSDAEARIAASQRPIDVIVKYNNLLREAARNEKTLVSLENNLRLLNLEKNIQRDPWELITEPTILDKPYSPKKLKYLVIFLFSGTLIGSLIKRIDENKKKIIFSFSKISSYLNSPLLANFNMDSKDEINELVRLFAESLYKENKYKNIALIPIGEILDSNKKLFYDNFNNFYKNEFVISSDFFEAKNFEAFIFITSKNVKETDLIKISKKLELCKKPPLGWVIINN